MAGLGRLSRAHEISIDRVNWRPASVLDQVFGESRNIAAAEAAEAPPESAPPPEILAEPIMPLPPAGPRTPPPSPAAPPMNLPPAVAGEPSAVSLAPQVGRLNIAQGFCTAAILLFCLLVPHSRGADGLEWWWDLSSQVGLLVFSVYGIVMALALVLLAVVLQGTARGWAFLVVSGLAGLLLSVAGGTAPHGGIAMAVVAPLPLALAVMAGSSVLRLYRAAAAVRMVQLISGVSAAVLALAGAVATLWSLAAGGASTGAGTAAMAVLAVGWLTVLAGAALGIVAGAMQRVSTAACKAAVATAVAGVVVLTAAAAIASVASAGEPAERFVLVQALRLIVVSCAVGALAAAGLCEVLVARPMQRAMPVLDPAGA